MTTNSVVNQIFQSESFVLQKGLNCPKPTIQGVGTDGLFLYQIHDSMQLVHQKAFSCTNSMIQCSWYTRRPFPVPTPRFNAVGTPESLFLYQIHDSMQLVHQTAFPCTKPTTQGGWYTRKPFPVQNPRFKALVHQTAFSCTNSTIQCSWYTRRPFPVPTPRFNAVGTPESLFLYQLHDSMQLVHQKAFSCTNSNHQIE